MARTSSLAHCTAGKFMTFGSLNHGSKADYIENVSASYSPSAGLIDGAPTTAAALSRYQWGMRQMLEGESYQSLFYDAPEDVVVAVVGHWPGHQGHPDLIDRYVAGFNLVEGGTNTSTTWDGNPATASTSHDQAVASIIAAEHNATGMSGVFHRARIMPIRASFQTLAQAINTAVSHGARVIHIAGYVTADYDEQFFSFLDDLYPTYPLYPAFRSDANRLAKLPAMQAARQAVRDATEAGVLVTTVVGNWSGVPMWTFMSQMAETLVAGPTNVLGEIPPHSSMSYAFDAFCPGGDRRPYSSGLSLPAGVIEGDATANADDILCAIGPDKYSFLTLGSAAGPHLAGAAAIIKSYLPGATAEVARRLIQRASKDAAPNLNILQATGGVLSLKLLRALLP